MTIEAYVVPEHMKLQVLPKHFGRHMLRVERRIYAFMTKFANAYSGGCWSFVELDNGGFYMCPPAGAYDMCIHSNGFQANMSADAAGITICLFAFSQLSMEHATAPFARYFHRLRDFAANHSEAAAIFRAIE